MDQNEINAEILEELSEGLRPAQIKNYAAYALAGKHYTIPFRFISNDNKSKAESMSYDDALLLVAKTFFKYK